MEGERARNQTACAVISIAASMLDCQLKKQSAETHSKELETLKLNKQSPRLCVSAMKEIIFSYENKVICF